MASKLAPHCLKPTAEAKLLVEAGCKLVKFVDDFGAAAEYLALSPGLTIIGRGYTDTGLPPMEGGDTPEQAAGQFVRIQKQLYYDRNPLIKIWEGHNEPALGGPNDKGALARMNWYGRFEAARLRLLADIGLRGVVGSFSTGYPEVGAKDVRMWEAFMPGLEAARQFDGMLGMHEYSTPWLWWMTGNYQESNCPGRRFQPGWREEDWGDLGWTTLRYRQVYRYALAPHGLDAIPLVITELGCDAVGHNCPGTPSGAWKYCVDFWSGYDGSRDPIDYWRNPSTRFASGGRDPERYYAEQLIWYDRELQKDSYVLAATVFTFGASNSAWEPYNVAGTRVPQFLAAHIRQTQADPVAPPPPIKPPPPPELVEGTAPAPDPVPAPTLPPAPLPPTNGVARGGPREQYSRVYVLLPPTATDPAWVEAVADSTWTNRRFTIGASSDDAGIGNLHARMVVAINPQGWGTTPPIYQWFAKNYPGVTYVSVRADSPTELGDVLRVTPLPAPIIARPGAPQTPTGVPREQYARAYILLNPRHTDPIWIKALARAAWARRATMGGSADDAGIGDLDSRQVIVINPREGYNGDIIAWFAVNYPGVDVKVVEGKTPDEVAGKVRGVLGV